MNVCVYDGDLFSGKLVWNVHVLLIACLKRGSSKFGFFFKNLYHAASLNFDQNIIEVERP